MRRGYAYRYPVILLSYGICLAPFMYYKSFLSSNKDGVNEIITVTELLCPNTLSIEVALAGPGEKKCADRAWISKSLGTSSQQQKIKKYNRVLLLTFLSLPFT